MEVRDTGKKRALNMIWTAAGSYDIDPPYLFYYKDDSPSLYPNTLEGLGFTCLDKDIILPFCEGIECGRDPNTFRTLVQLVLEIPIFDRCRAQRPGLVWLRRQHAETRIAEMKDPRLYMELSWERQILIRCYRILGRDDSLFYDRELQLANELEAAGALPEEQMVAETKRILWHHLMYHFTPARKSETIDAVGAGIFLYLFGKLFSRDITAKAAANSELSGGEAPKKSFTARFFTLWKHMLSETTEEEDLSFIRDTFGPCLYSEAEMRALTELYCTGCHLRSHLWYTAAGPDRLHRSKQQEQRAINLHFYNADKRFYERSIHRITEQLRHALEEQQEPDVVRGQTGRLEANAVYRAAVLHDLSVFRREVAHPVPDFTVDLLLDASSSRIKDQSAIAAQAYTITKSLEALHIPVQVTSFQSIRGYTVLQQMKSYAPGGAENLFSFYAAGANRDGLALDAFEALLAPPGMGTEKHILLVLTDGRPADTRAAYAPGLFNRGKDYDDDLAVDDTAAAVRRLRKRGVEAAAVFLGDTYGVRFLKRIYGNAFIRILAPDRFPDAVLSLLLRILERLKDRG